MIIKGHWETVVASLRNNPIDNTTWFGSNLKNQITLKWTEEYEGLLFPMEVTVYVQ